MHYKLSEKKINDNTSMLLVISNRLLGLSPIQAIFPSIFRVLEELLSTPWKVIRRVEMESWRRCFVRWQLLGLRRRPPSKHSLN
ncbi:unnamed protein product [Nezara viridula]|uniref:Uncharacterized protein n=1 Tax=Nezara viridula TaxID=85310 RepID=A0A9P0MRR8_NEZVI|nr:unnamed protein product [Nezara viridula]